MNNNDGFTPGFIVGAIVASMLAIIICNNAFVLPLKREAIKRGAAEWAVSENGNTEFRWKEVKK